MKVRKFVDTTKQTQRAELVVHLDFSRVADPRRLAVLAFAVPSISRHLTLTRLLPFAAAQRKSP